MKVIGLEEHYVTAEVVEAWANLDPRWQDPVVAGSAGLRQRLLEIGDQRLDAMDEAGIDVQVASLTSPGLWNLAPAVARALQSDCNDQLADAVRAHPDRLQGFATLAAPDPDAAADELSRAVMTLGFNGALVISRVRGMPIDNWDFWPVFEAAEHLRAPLYLHPQSPPPAVRDAYYSGFDDIVSAAFATHGVGWHYDTGVQLLRLILAGVFDRFPDLQVILGHWGEMVLFFLDRIDRMAETSHLERPVSEYLRSNVFITPGGIFSTRYLRWALEVVGADRIMFAADYPFAPTDDGAALRFLGELADADRNKIASGNWDQLCAGIRR
ncbi:amidohydrolase [Mycobacterium gallinarum]|uniref:Amidohydrolase n=1 Tax=Mycobacterium gallinarum TaxID=39689 RepID=A0A9W4B4B7_9MYCO|nr:amidohydrolase family protein [Mycobacterium gallinarum]BBY93675.1 amidohydrolase [Mycobacterium gallinarum]